MIKEIRIYRGQSFDPYYNLAVEQQLLETVPGGCCILYLWQNSNTVVIGYNQNSFKECRTALLAEEGGHLARRLSGGGAVFHDLGNLNFTFLVNSEDYDVKKQLSVIAAACRRFGITAEVSGRNDVLAQGRKFSGNAFYSHSGKSYHHGTLLVDVDMTKLGRYLVPSAAKLRAKGVDSVRSRVVNLKELAPDMTIGALKSAMEDAFEEVYGLRASVIGEDELDKARIAELTARNSGWEWNFGRELKADLELNEKFAWGEITVCISSDSGVIKEAAVYTDSMDDSLSAKLEKALAGVRLESSAVENAVFSSGISDDAARDVSALIVQNI